MAYLTTKQHGTGEWIGVIRLVSHGRFGLRERGSPHEHPAARHSAARTHGKGQERTHLLRRFLRDLQSRTSRLHLESGIRFVRPAGHCQPETQVRRFCTPLLPSVREEACWKVDGRRCIRTRNANFFFSAGFGFISLWRIPRPTSG